MILEKKDELFMHEALKEAHKAFDKNENNLVVKRLNDNTWQIPDINKLHKITYWADDILNREDQKETFYGRDQMLGTFGTNFEKGDKP